MDEKTGVEEGVTTAPATTSKPPKPQWLKEQEPIVEQGRLATAIRDSVAAKQGVQGVPLQPEDNTPGVSTFEKNALEKKLPGHINATPESDQVNQLPPKASRLRQLLRSIFS
jgi:hypothetical protein